MEFASIIVAATLLASAAPSMATSIIHAAAGEACNVTTFGDFSCIWTAMDGSTSEATGSASIDTGLEWLDLSIVVTSVPLNGWIEAELPYSAPVLEYDRDGRLKWNQYVWLRSGNTDIRIFGTIQTSASFSSLKCSDYYSVRYGCVFDRDLSTKYLTDITNSSWTQGNTVSEDGLWSFSMQWAFEEGSPVASIGGRSTLGVPEPSTWVMLLAGFGLVGTAVRRQRNRKKPVAR